jgi:hypothetical protein
VRGQARGTAGFLGWLVQESGGVRARASIRLSQCRAVHVSSAQALKHMCLSSHLHIPHRSDMHVGQVTCIYPIDPTCMLDKSLAYTP